MAEAIVFYTLAAFILGFGVLVITARNTVHSVLFLVVNFLFVAALYASLGAQFLAMIHVLVYAGGIVVLYLFVVMLVNLKGAPEAYSDPHRKGRLGLLLSLVVLGELGLIAGQRYAVPLVAPPPSSHAALGNVEQVGYALYTDYLIPFEVASVLLLVAMIGAIVLAKREL